MNRTNTNMKKYFAYGSNMDASRMIARGVNFTRRIPVKAKDVKLTFDKLASFNGSYGYATIEMAKGDIVEGILYTISKAGELKLDSYEGYPYHYEKWDIIVRDENNIVHRAMTYIAPESKTKKGLKPSKEYLNHLLAGRDCLSEEYYKKLLKFREI